MTKIISLFILEAVFCFTFFTVSYSDINLIQTNCKKTPFYDLCVLTLKSDPRSSTADVPGLARIVADSVNAKAIATLNQISALLKSVKDPTLEKALEGSDIPVAIDAIEKNNPKFAVQSATDAGNEAQACENSFAEKASNSPIFSGNKAVHDLSVVLQSIASLLL
ncbi:hypothetical protein ES288_A10G209500v1 [Gossypium darwinii]|uniref:Pectinesterase inhibitor domain-containing protein n=1 Tax=Gossypium darwinii TaxID=34276 RepID=A0A5D2F370_GOSDA|nr:hypothetical protein ES288_A10G209500v1 [Gossypium darwinii]